MIYQQSKYHSNSFTHFLQLHSSINSTNSSGGISNNLQELPVPHDSEKIELHDSSSNTSLEVNDSVGKSFTIAAILGLNKNSICGLSNRQSDDIELNEYNKDFSSIINLSAHSKLFQKFENDNLSHNHHCIVGSQSDPQMPEQCFYDNNTSNSSYQEHLMHKQLSHDFNHHSLLNANFHRSNPEASLNQALQQQHNNVLHNLQHSNATILNKALQHRDRNRLEQFPNKHKNSSSTSIKNKRVRTIFTPEQLERLEAEFERQQYMVGPERLYLAHTLQLTEAQVKVWFQNRRIKWRKHHLEITQQHLAIARQRQIGPNSRNSEANNPPSRNLLMSQDSPDLTNHAGPESVDGRIGVSDNDD